eukprot:1192520-Prorocentrum_minimum.AAC.7
MAGAVGELRSPSSFRFLIAGLLLCAPYAHGLKLEIEGQRRECVQESANEVGQSISGSFVSDINFHYHEDWKGARTSTTVDTFDFSVVDPNMKTVYTARRKADHRFEIPVQVVGIYTFCFYNSVFSPRPRTVHTSNQLANWLFNWRMSCSSRYTP